MEGAIAMLVICVMVFIIATVNHQIEQEKLDVFIANRQVSGKDVICPTCKSTVHVPCVGEYTCHICNNDFSYGQHNRLRVFCPSCGKGIFVDGVGTHTCPKCYNTFTYGEQKSNTNVSNLIDNADYKKYYDVLGCSYNVTEDEVSKKYKEMSMKFHPDKIMSKDLPEELVQLSTQKFIEIQEAYEKIKARKSDLS